MDIVTLERIAVNSNRVDYYFTVSGKLQKYFSEKHHLFYQYNHNISDVPLSILTIPFVANVMPLIWITDSAVLVNELDSAFYESLGKIRAAYQVMFPAMKFKGRIGVEIVTENSYAHELEAACLFSGGLDAVTTFIRLKDKNPVLVTEYGWHRDDIQTSEVWEADKKNAVEFAQFHGLSNILVESNFGTFVIEEKIDLDFSKKLGGTWWQGLHHGLAFLSAGIPAAYKLKVKTIYIASSLHAGHIARCASDPTVDNEIKYASGDIFHDAYELTRQQKVKVVADYYQATREPVRLRVCFRKEENCCKCEKCIRTILGIAAEGKNPRDFGFDIPDNLSEHVRQFLNENVKFMPPDLIIMVWNLIKERMADNRANIQYKDLLEWFLEYDLAANQRKSLLHYRVTKFFPILKRKINDRLQTIGDKN